MELNTFFDKLKVVELAGVLAGPLVGSFLAELGAEVLKIENPKTGGDVTRTWKLPEENPLADCSAYYHAANFGKKVLMLDLSGGQDRNVLFQYIEQADVVISNFQKATAEKLSIDELAIRTVNASIIIIQLNAFDYDDPRPGYDLVMQAESGFLSMSGEGTSYAKMPVAMVDVIAAHQMKEALLLAIIHKMRTGRGSTVHVSLYKAAISALVNQATNYLMEGHLPQRIGTRHPNIAPYGEILVSSDKVPLMLAVGSDAQFARLLSIFNTPVSLHPEWSSNAGRLTERLKLSNFLSAHALNFTAEFLEVNLLNNGVPFARIKDLSDVFQEPNSQSMVMKNNIAGQENGFYISNIAFSPA
ncbi:MAG: CoA transferase [Saprospiraceae bacterium]|nr:CoA transferase [Saprospiraceae bacterium]